MAAAELTALKESITNFTAVQTKSWQDRAASASTITDLVTLFAELYVVLNAHPDPVMAKFRFMQPTSFSEYETAGLIEDSAATHGGEKEKSAPGRGGLREIFQDFQQQKSRKTEKRAGASRPSLSRKTS